MARGGAPFPARPAVLLSAPGSPVEEDGARREGGRVSNAISPTSGISGRPHFPTPASLLP
jgi:hypothetical protein